MEGLGIDYSRYLELPWEGSSRLIAATDETLADVKKERWKEHLASLLSMPVLGTSPLGYLQQRDGSQ
ncbi:hypothetical protein DPEC_G00200490 [Dallia pectoralis]|uniref:Uncharacterized protein n=1 Tax=Dallia pectoralis TaxID=75939 RepID=A0ACC2G910_DALPE|nr:hypothetical protein DPEC_G00200490 [Dallia pectoralis]